MMDINILKQMIADDSLGLLKIEEKKSSTNEAENRLISSFQEINDFVRSNGSKPKDNKNNVHEYKLYARLDALKSRNDVVERLIEYDEFNLLGVTREINTLEDLFLDDELGLLTLNDEGIFDLKHVPHRKKRPDYVARRKPCKDFNNFAKLFKSCQLEIANKKKALKKFTTEPQIQLHNFYVLKGMLVYIDRIGPKQIRGGITNARLRCIFENGTESDMLLRSLSRRLYTHGRRVIDVT